MPRLRGERIDRSGPAGAVGGSTMAGDCEVIESYEIRVLSVVEYNDLLLYE